MSKKLSLLVVALGIAAVLLAACGSSKKDDKGGGKVSLTQTLASTSGITVKYPDGWTAKEMSGGVEVANNQQILSLLNGSDAPEMPAGTAGLIAQVLPADHLGVPASSSMKDVLTHVVPSMAGGSQDIKTGEITASSLNGKEAAQVSIAYDKVKMEGIVSMVKVDDQHVMLMSYVTHQGELKTFEATLRQIAESLTYARP